ncbi:MAG: DHA2 family efflux MFS transporter permease subunit [Desulfobacteraceae bacterium]|nr:DHA2 family efflux MFS transporter permease subunit [Desulfobacteraceae bacterium]
MTSEQDPAPGVSKWTVALTIMLPTFIEVMDTSVVNVSLPHIQGSLNAGVDESTWVLTSYLVSNAIVIPITGWLSGIFGRKRYLIFSLLIFTVSSILCGAAPSLPVLIVARIVQGLGGGGLQPLSQAILLETFPRKEHGIAMAIFGMGVVLAPIIGPVIGGWITDNWTWRWVFYINLPIGILAVFLAMLFVHDPPYIKRAGVRIDTWGLFFLSVGLGSLQIVLDKGEREDWFASQFIVVLSIAAVAALALFVYVEMRTSNPVVDLGVFRDKSFAAGCTIMFLGFFCLFGSIVLLPLYLQQLMGYTALWAGLVLGPGGMSSFFVMPAAGILLARGFKPRHLLILGLAITAYSELRMSEFNLEADFFSVSVPRFLQGLGLGLFFVPLSAATYANISREKTGNASGIFNLLRNLGGSFGVAFSTTVLSQRAQFHQTFLSENISPYNPAFQEAFRQTQNALQMSGAPAQTTETLAYLYREVLRQASMLSFNDTFYLLSIATAILIPVTLLLRRGRRGAPPPETPMH